MISNGAISRSLFALVMVSGGSVTMAQGLASKPSPPRSAHVAKAASSADPFEDSTPTPKPTAGPAAPAPSKPSAAAASEAPVKPAIAVSSTQHRPSKELETFMKSFEGSWKCETTFAAGSLWPGSQALSAKTDITIRKEFGGISWHGEFRLAKTATTAATYGVFQIGYSPSSKQATYVSYDSVGSAMMGAGSLAGDSVTFAEEGFFKGAKVKVRETLTAKGPRQLYHKVEIEQGGGYQAMAEDTCSK